MKTQNYLDIRARLSKRSSPDEGLHIVHKRNNPAIKPRLSLILLDWTCRERFDTLDWLLKQDVPRHEYEVIWIELHERVVPEALAKADTVITCRQSQPYHKHKGYNLGLLHAHGELICVCDSDAVFPRNFVSSVFNSFHPDGAANPIPLVLMHHELRTSFTYPDNLTDAEDLKNREKWKWWPVVPNAGACMTVRRSDAIRFGGFDEDDSLSGYLCGPYDLGWRLVNAGWPEVWHDDSCVLWHFAHPDPVGANGFAPQLKLLLENTHPHVDMHALTAVDAFSSGRFQPRRENPQIFALRMADRRIGTAFEEKYAGMTGPEGFPGGMVLRMRLAMVADIYWTIVSRFTFGLIARGLRHVLGESRYVRWRALVFYRLLRQVDPSLASTLVKEYKGFNLLQHHGMIFGLPQDLGAINPSDDRQMSHPAIVKARSIQEAQDIIERENPASFLPVSEHRRHSYAIVRWRHRFYAVPDGADPNNLIDDECRADPTIFSGDTLDAVIAQIDAVAARPVVQSA